MIIFVFNSSQLENTKMSTLSVEGRGIDEQQFLTVYMISEMFLARTKHFKLFKLRVAASSIL